MKWLRRIFYSLAVLCLALVVFYRLWFLRLPDRQIPHNLSEYVSPANGVVVSVRHWSSTEEVETKGDWGAINLWTKDVDTAGTIISIQMDVTNVHFQRAPQTSTVLSERYTKGSFHNAVQMNNDYGIRFENEHNEILFQTANGTKYKIVQIAGFLARRIESYIQPGQKLQQGDVLGLIKLGSQVTVVFPHHIQPQVEAGAHVVDGVTVLGKEK